MTERTARVAAPLLGLLLVTSAVPAAAAPPDGLPPGVRPVVGRSVRAFAPGLQDWDPGHRGVDLEAAAGEPVRAAAAGVVTFAGRIAGRPVVVISHGRWRTTYEPVRPAVARGDLVAAGQVIGALLAGHRCATDACLHWGLRSDLGYRDPLALLSHGRLRLLPGPLPGGRAATVPAAFGVRHPLYGVA